MSAKKTDNTTLAAIQVSYAHHEIHAGSGYAFTRNATLPLAGDDELLLVTPTGDKWLHFTFAVTSDDAFEVDFYEGTGLTTPTDLSASIFNKNRNSDKVSILTIGHTPVGGAGDGPLIYSLAGGARAQVTTVGHSEEWVLAADTAYLFRITGAQNDVCHWHFEWYEHTNVFPGEVH